MKINIKEGVELTRRQAELIDAINAGLEAGTWALVPEPHWITVMWVQELETPDHARKPFKSSVGEVPAQWPRDTYTRSLHLSIITGGRSWSQIMTVNPCPWVVSRQHRLTLTRAIETIRNPQSAFL